MKKSIIKQYKRKEKLLNQKIMVQTPKRFSSWLSIKNHPENRELTVKEQRKILDFVMPILKENKLHITWTNYIHSWRCNPDKYINIPKPTTVWYAQVLLHELGHLQCIKLYNIKWNQFSQIKHEQFADTYSFNMLNYFGIKWFDLLWLNRLENVKDYYWSGDRNKNYPLTNFYIKPLHLI